MSIASQPKPVPARLRQAQRGVLLRLQRVRRRMRTHLLVEGLFWVLTSIVVAAAASLPFDWLLRFELSTRIGLLAIAVIGITVVAVRKLIVPLLLPLGDLDLAAILDRRSPGVGQKIANVLELPELLRSEKLASPSMVEAAVIECASALDRVDLTAMLNVERRRKLLLAGATWLVLVGGFCLLWPGVAHLWARRWLAGSTLRWPQHNYLSIVGLEDESRLLVPRGELSLVQIDARPRFKAVEGAWILSGRGEPLVIEGEVPALETPEQVSLSYKTADGTRRGNATQFDETNFRYELPPLAEPVELSVTGGDDWLGPITIEPIDRPAIESLEITSLAPGSAGKQTHRVGEGDGQLLFLPQTRIELRLVASAPLRSAEAFNQGSPLSGWQRVDARTYSLAWTMSESLALEFRLVGERGGLTSKPYFLAIGLLKDREPRVTIRAAGVGRRVTPVARIPLVLRASDDFSVASLGLDWERTALRNEKPQVDTGRHDLTLPASQEPLAELELDHEVELKGRELAPGNVIKLRGLATDACALGVQSGNSRWLSFQIVSSDELFYEILMRQREQRARFATALESAKVQAQTLAGLAKSQELPPVVRAYQVVGRTVGQVTTALEATLEEMTLNELGNEQARENLQTSVITPLHTLHEELLVRLRGALDGLPQGEQISESRRVEAIVLADQTVEVMQSILAQMSLWESFVDVVNQLKQVIERQNKVLKSTEEEQKKRTDELFDE